MRQRVIAEESVRTDEFIARVLFNIQFKGRSWDHAREFCKKAFLLKAKKALKESGYEDSELVKRHVPLVVPEKEEV